MVKYFAYLLVLIQIMFMLIVLISELFESEVLEIFAAMYGLSTIIIGLALATTLVVERIIDKREESKNDISKY